MATLAGMRPGHPEGGHSPRARRRHTLNDNPAAKEASASPPPCRRRHAQDHLQGFEGGSTVYCSEATAALVRIRMPGAARRCRFEVLAAGETLALHGYSVTAFDAGHCTGEPPCAGAQGARSVRGRARHRPPAGASKDGRATLQPPGAPRPNAAAATMALSMACRLPTSCPPLVPVQAP
jgi:hypothetical protein